jgi:E3 ubiquitin-protein ligase RNF216
MNNTLYAPTHIFLASEIKAGNLSYKRKTVPTRPKGKGKEKQEANFEAERRWLLSRLQNEVAKNDTTVAAQVPSDEDVLDGIECGCCFADYSFVRAALLSLLLLAYHLFVKDQMVQCPDMHLFCSSCMTSYASNLLGEHNPNIICMDQSGCKLPFPLSQLRRFLTPKLMELYDRVKQMKEIEAAGLENLESCPFCEYKVVIENPEEKLFRCEGGDCGVVSCRGCKKVVRRRCLFFCYMANDWCAFLGSLAKKL